MLAAVAVPKRRAEPRSTSMSRPRDRDRYFLMKTLPRVATEMTLHVLAYNLTRVMNIMGVQPLLAAIRA
jgi:hypothetical protein